MSQFQMRLNHFLFQQDLDRLFSYKSTVEVIIDHLMLGFMRHFLNLCVVIYIIGVALMWEEGYLIGEHSRGFTVTFLSGDVLATSASGGRRLFRDAELTGPTLENGSVFVATKVAVYQESRGTCEDFELPCNTPADCTSGVGALCSPNNVCVEPSWCPKENPGRPGEAALPEVYKLNSDKMKIWAKSSIRFDEFLPDNLFTTDQEVPIMYPKPGHNTFTVRDLLMLTDPPTRYEEISELGTAIQVIFTWKCKWNYGGMNKQCLPKLSANRLDDSFGTHSLDPDDVGFNWMQVHEMGPNKREVHKMSGVRFYFNTFGTLQTFSMVSTMVILSMGFSLMSIVPVIVDALMLRFVKEHFRFFARKYEITPHFNSPKASAKLIAGEHIDDQQEEDMKDGMSLAEELMDEEDESWRERFLADEQPPNGVPVRTPSDYLLG